MHTETKQRGHPQHPMGAKQGGTPGEGGGGRTWKGKVAHSTKVQQKGRRRERGKGNKGKREGGKGEQRGRIRGEGRGGNYTTTT